MRVCHRARLRAWAPVLHTMLGGLQGHTPIVRRWLAGLFDDDALLPHAILDNAPRSVFYFPALGLRSVRDYNFRTLFRCPLSPKARLQRLTFSARDARPHRSRACVARHALLREQAQGPVARQSSDTSPRCQGQGAGRDLSHEIVNHRDSRHAPLQS